MKDWAVEWITKLIPLIFAAFLASLGGAVHYLNKISNSNIPFRKFNFFLEILTSGFVGIITFMLCDYVGWGWEVTAAIVAISGHMGARALILIEMAILPALRAAILSMIGVRHDHSEGKAERQEKAD